ncbi:MAG: CotH kinase family protein [Clostridia bacterium]|nr:CotH kinase family protein [Clostridia bacterium]
MKILKTIVSLLLAAVFLASFPAAAVPGGSEYAPFSDVSPDAWYYGDVNEAYEKGFVEGKAARIFDPEGSVTRAEFLTVLSRMAGADAAGAGKNAAFSDVKPSDWFFDFVGWGTAAGLVTGYPDGTFAPDAPITRAEAAALIARFIRISKYRILPDPDASDPFSDVSESDWFYPDVDAVRKCAILFGKENGRFAPGDRTLRSELAALAVRIHNANEDNQKLAEGFAVINIATETGGDVESKEEYIRGSFSLTAADGRNISEDSFRIRGRGNQSWMAEKKSYKLKFDSKVCLMTPSFGDTKAKDWVLIANHGDKSLIRNYAAMRTALVLDGLEWVPYAELVEVYLNGEYRGVYLLSEQVEVSKNRVDIKDGEIDDPGFLIELDGYASGEYNREFFTTEDRRYSVKSDCASSDQVIAMKLHLETLLNMAREGNREKIEEYFDLPSLIDTYLLYEFTKNPDVGWSSFFMYFKEPHGKLYFGPPWDFDIAFGNGNEGYHFSGLYAGQTTAANGRYVEDVNEWLAAFVSHEWFREALRDRWNEKKGEIRETLEKCYKEAWLNIDLLERNFEKWPVIHERIFQESFYTLALNSCGENIDWLYGWIEKRTEWIDPFLNSVTFGSEYPGDASRVGVAPKGVTEPLKDTDGWVIADWYPGERLVQIYMDILFQSCIIKDNRIILYLGGAHTLTVKSINKLILEERMGVDTSRYTLVIDEDQLNEGRKEFSGLGHRQALIWRLTFAVMDLETGETSTSREYEVVFNKDLSLNGKFE